MKGDIITFKQSIIKEASVSNRDEKGYYKDDGYYHKKKAPDFPQELGTHFVNIEIPENKCRTMCPKCSGPPAYEMVVEYKTIMLERDKNGIPHPPRDTLILPPLPEFSSMLRESKQ